MANEENSVYNYWNPNRYLNSHHFINKNHSDQTTSEDTIEIKQMVHAYSSGEVEGESASITATELIVTNQAGEKILPFT